MSFKPEFESRESDAV